MGQVIQLIDSYTKENVNYEETAVWHDGTPMDDAKVDNVLYRKRGTKYYKRNYSGYVDIRWFGAIADGVTDNAPALRNAIRALRGVNNTSQVPAGGVIFFPAGEYAINEQIDIEKSGIRLKGESMMSTIIRTNYTGSLFRVKPYQEADTGRFFVEDMQFRGTGRQGTCFDLLFGMYNCEWNNVHIRSFDIGLHLKAVYVNTFNNLYTAYNNIGIKTEAGESANMNTFVGGWCRDNWQLTDGTFKVIGTDFEPTNATCKFSNTHMQDVSFERCTFGDNNSSANFYHWVELRGNCKLERIKLIYDASALPYRQLIKVNGSRNEINLGIISGLHNLVLFSEASRHNKLRFNCKWQTGLDPLSSWNNGTPVLDLGRANRVHYDSSNELESLDYGIDLNNKTEIQLLRGVRNLVTGVTVYEFINNTNNTADVSDPAGTNTAVKMVATSRTTEQQNRCYMHNPSPFTYGENKIYVTSVYVYLKSGDQHPVSFRVGNALGDGTRFYSADLPKDRWIRIINFGQVPSNKILQWNVTFVSGQVGDTMYIYNLRQNRGNTPIASQSENDNRIGDNPM